MALLQKDLFNSPYSGVFCATNDLVTLVPPGIPDDAAGPVKPIVAYVSSAISGKNGDGQLRYLSGSHKVDGYAGG